MKTFSPALLIAIMMIASCSSVDISSASVPSIVRNTIEGKYPGAFKASWEKHENVYEAELEINDSTELSVQIDETGKIIQQKQDVKNSELTPAITDFIKANYTDLVIDDIEKLEKGVAVYYQVELKAKNNKETHLVFSADGQELKSIPYWD